MAVMLVGSKQLIEYASQHCQGWYAPVYGEVNLYSWHMTGGNIAQVPDPRLGGEWKPQSRPADQQPATELSAPLTSTPRQSIEIFDTQYHIRTYYDILEMGFKHDDAFAMKALKL